VSKLYNHKEVKKKKRKELQASYSGYIKLNNHHYHLLIIIIIRRIMIIPVSRDVTT